MTCKCIYDFNNQTNAIFNFKQNQHKLDLTTGELKLDNIRHWQLHVLTPYRINANLTIYNSWIETEISNQQLHTPYRWHIHDLNKATNKFLMNFKQNQQNNCMTLRTLYPTRWHIHNLNKPTIKLLIRAAVAVDKTNTNLTKIMYCAVDGPRLRMTCMQHLTITTTVMYLLHMIIDLSWPQQA